MNIAAKRFLFWTPRAVCVAFAIFLSLFALDVFNEGYGLGETIEALAIHLVPVYIVLAVLAIAWRWEWVGAAGFAALALWYAKGNWRHHPDRVVVIAGPLVVMAALFFMNWLRHDELRARP